MLWQSYTIGITHCLENSQTQTKQYRKLNTKTYADTYPIPNIQEIQESLDGITVFRALDLKVDTGKWKCILRHEKQTALICPYGFCQFKVMPLGWKRLLQSFKG